MNYDHTIDKRQVRTAFERAAPDYDKAAILQREVCDRMLSRLDYIKHLPDVILDAGSGTGYGTRKLLTRYPAARMLAIDIAPAMHLQARPSPSPWRQLLKLGRTEGRNQTSYIAGDIEQLPFKDSCAGLVWSNLVLQWCNDLEKTFSEVHRVLHTGGLFMFSTFGPDTLKELRQAFRNIDDYSHVNRFTDMHDIGDTLVHSGFATPVMDMEYFTLTYDDVIGVMRDLKAIGAHNVTQGRRRGLTGKAAWQKAVGHYESKRIAGKLPATFEVVYGHAWKLQPRGNVLTPETRRQLGLI
ncbi:malonyl-ACP O-methyltransferase BioC [Nitrosospira briensis]|uniref:malonyl-ACP O-methyltransferase BioC n=1 Tax=Nitrosospira briensis TaxID=35799 RepID=UPI0008F0E7CA|nr:malonyl-ACP O-methyltransferase BioC [Nitrosospira briensis]SFN64548.1 malonyl-CoA O-methyltransferase [Nitrosospira briensis]